MFCGYLQVMPLAEAKHPNASKLGEAGFWDNDKDTIWLRASLQVDMTGTFFAGVGISLSFRDSTVHICYDAAAFCVFFVSSFSWLYRVRGFERCGA